jgi:hypothetical protein
VLLPTLTWSAMFENVAPEILLPTGGIATFPALSVNQNPITFRLRSSKGEAG